MMKVMVVATQSGGLTAFLQLHSSFLTREYPKSISPSYRCGLRYANESLSHHGQSSVPKSKYFVARSLPEIRDKMAVARAHQGHNGCEFV